MTDTVSTPAFRRCRYYYCFPLVDGKDKRLNNQSRVMQLVSCRAGIQTQAV